jgi:Flp pilus assembly protein TadD
MGREGLERFPQDPELLAAKAVALARLGDTDGAMSFSDASIEERGTMPMCGWLEETCSSRERSTRQIIASKRPFYWPTGLACDLACARIRAFYQQFSLALKLLKKAIELNTGHFLLWLELGNCQASLGLVGPAEFSYKQAQS